MKIEILLFAAAKDIFGTDRLAVELPDQATVQELKRALIAHEPAAVDLLPRCALSVDQQYATDNQVIQPDQEIALIPPVSGG